MINLDFPRLTEMYQSLRSSDVKDVLPAYYWEKMSNDNTQQLRESESFKRSVAMNYFTWSGADDQPFNLLKILYKKRLDCLISGCLLSFFNILKNKFKYSRYTFLTCLLWEYSQTNANTAKHLTIIKEPTLGDPILIYDNKKRLISQDLANSLLEYESIIEYFSPAVGKTIMELGAGYGRNAYVFLTLNRGIRYIIVDIPPALWLAEHYLSSIFYDRKIFRWRDFKKYDDIKEEFEKSEIIFLLPTQLQSLPKNIIDCFISISSLQEMPRGQVDYFLETMSKLSTPASISYLKQLRKGVVMFDSGTTNIDAYLVKLSDLNFKILEFRDCLVQTNFSEIIAKKMAKEEKT